MQGVNGSPATDSYSIGFYLITFPTLTVFTFFHLLCDMSDGGMVCFFTLPNMRLFRALSPHVSTITVALTCRFKPSIYCWKSFLRDMFLSWREVVSLIRSELANPPTSSQEFLVQQASRLSLTGFPQINMTSCVYWNTKPVWRNFQLECESFGLGTPPISTEHLWEILDNILDRWPTALSTTFFKMTEYLL